MSKTHLMAGTAAAAPANKSIPPATAVTRSTATAGKLSLPPQTTAAIPAGSVQLVGDIGGTHARFALVESAGGALSHIQVLRCADFPELIDAVRHYLQTAGLSVHSAALGIATPLQGDEVQMTNHHWRFSVRALRQGLGLQRLVMLNDFSAMALGVPMLATSQKRRIGAAGVGGDSDGGDSGGRDCGGGHNSNPPPAIRSPIAVLGPGTGLGVSGLMPTGDNGYLALAGEGGHITLAATTDAEAAALAWLRQKHRHVSAERILSGPGLSALHQALASIHGHTAAALLDPTEVTRTALAEPGSLCRQATHMFCDFLGTVASDLALTLGATGGVYLAGGVVPALGDLFIHSGFRSRFDNKGRFGSYLAKIPTYLIESPYCALQGAAFALSMDHLAGALDVRA